MTTTANRTDTMMRLSDSERHCAGCPLCNDPSLPLCPQNHPECPGRHPICKVCRHCVLRGNHVDGAEDVRSGQYASRNDYLN